MLVFGGGDLFMKRVKCNQLGGPESCAVEFEADSFEQIAELSKEHAVEMAKRNDEAHLDAMQEMREMMENDPEGLQKWMEKKEEEFNALPDSG